MTLLHALPDFADLIAVAARNNTIDPGLIEKDYWLMHCLWGLQQLDYKFELKGGTSLSKGYGLIDRFSEDIDILMLVHPKGMNDFTRYAIDQFVLGGGRALIFVDANAEVDVPADGRMRSLPRSEFNKNLNAWGLNLADNKLTSLSALTSPAPAKGATTLRPRVFFPALTSLNASGNLTRWRT